MNKYVRSMKGCLGTTLCFDCDPKKVYYTCEYKRKYKGIKSVMSYKQNFHPHRFIVKLYKITDDLLDTLAIFSKRKLPVLLKDNGSINTGLIIVKMNDNMIGCYIQGDKK